MIEIKDVKNNILTIALVTYNRSNLIEYSIKSILNQNFYNFNLLILDNCSIDNTEEIVKSFKDTRIIYKKNDKNIGGIKNMNLAFELSTSKYLLIFHDDDIMKKDLIKKEIEIMESDNDIVLVASNIEFMDYCGKFKLNKKGLNINKDKIYYKYQFIEDFLNNGIYLPCPTVMFRKSFIDRYDLLFREFVNHCSDVYFCAEANIYDKKIYLISEPLVKYRLPNVSNQQELKQIGKNYISQILLYKNLYALLENTERKDLLKKIIEKKNDYLIKLKDDVFTEKITKAKFYNELKSEKFWLKDIGIIKKTRLLLSIKFPFISKIATKLKIKAKNYLKSLSKIVLFPFFRLFLLLILFSNTILKIFLLRKKSNKVIFLPEFANFGGTRSYFKMLVDFYINKNYDLILLLKKNQLDDEITEIINKNNMKYYILDLNENKHLKNLFSFLNIVLKEKAFLIHGSIGNVGNYIEIFLLPLRVIYTLHVYPFSKFKGWQIKQFLWITSIVLNKDKIILTVSNYSKRMIAKYALKKDKKSRYIKVVYNTTTLEDRKKNIKIKNKKILVLTLGHVAWSKNIEGWYEVAKEVIKEKKNIEFIWAGDGPDYNKYIKKIFAENIKDIKFVGFKEDINKLYFNADIYFQPSNLESLGIAVLDAMKYSLPCVVSNAGGLPESVVNNETGFVLETIDIKGMVEKIILLSSNEALRKSMGVNGYKRYNDKFSYAKWEKQILELHCEI